MKLSKSNIDFMSEIISIRSVGSDPVPGAPFGAKNREVLEVFLNKAKSLGFETNVFNDKVGYIDFGKGDKTVAIVCHLDVVPEGDGWETDPFTLTIKDDAFYARGIVDDKGPALASFFALCKLKEDAEDLGCRIRLILGTDEERTCDCMHEYVTNPDTIIPDCGFTPDAEFPAIFAEKGILQATFQAAGISDVNVNGGSAANMVPAICQGTIKGNEFESIGKPAHASKPDLGINAITKFVDEHYVKCEVFDFIKYYFLNDNVKELTGCDITDLSGELTSNVGILKIDENCQSVTIDFRYPATFPSDKLIDSLKAAASKFGLAGEYDKHHMKPIVFEKDSPLITAVMESWNKNRSRFTGYKEEYDKYNEAIAIGGGTYARHVPNIVAFGPQTPWSEDQCHQANEHISINDFEVMIDVIYESIIKLSK